MGADQIAAIRPFLVELEDATFEGSGSEYCAGFGVPGCEAAWVQVVRGMVNVAYPFTDDPVERLSHLQLITLPGLMLKEWRPGMFATFSFDEHATSKEVARFVDGISWGLFSAVVRIIQWMRRSSSCS